MPPITYPILTREAVVYVRFVVSKEGLPQQIEIDPTRGFHNDAFREAAIRGVQRMRFEPATLAGEPVEAGPLIMPVNFTLRHDLEPEEMSVTEPFRRELDRVGYLFRRRDYAAAHNHAEWMLREKVQLKFEYAVLQAQLAQTHATLGNVEAALQHAIAATLRTGVETPGFRLDDPVPPNDAGRYAVPREMLFYLLDLRMRLQTLRGDAIGALKTYREFAGLKQFAPTDEPAVLADRLVELLKSGRPLASKGRLVNGFWSHDQYHPAFRLVNVAGQVDLLRTRCEGSKREFAYVEGNTWAIPDAAQACVVEVHGEPGTTFDLIELPREAAEP